MSLSVPAQRLFDELSEQLELHWLAGLIGGKRALEVDEKQRLRPSLVGFLNLIHPNNVQILGREELEHLDALDARQRWETLAQILADKPTALIVADGLAAPDDLIEGAQESSTPVWKSSRPGVEVVSFMQHFLSRELARSVTLHGVFMEVFSIGVLITGSSGAGKSELALELISRGHRLVADDAPEFTLIAPDIIDGTCPPLLQDCLEVRGLGILDVRAMFGDSAVKNNKYLRLIIHLDLEHDFDNEEIDRLRGAYSVADMLGLQIPKITIPVAPGRNMAVIVEAAVRNHMLKLKGFDAAERFLARHDEQLREDDAAS